MYKFFSTFLFVFLIQQSVAQFKSEIIQDKSGVYYDKRTKIIVAFQAEPDMFPSAWRGGEIKGKATSLNTAEIARSIAILNRTLSKYPTEVLVNNLEKVYILESLEFYGVGYGGTNSLDRVYVTNKGGKNNYSDEYIEKVFHAEFSSILLRNYPQFLDESQWARLNPAGFTYGGSGVEAIKNGESSEKFSSTHHERSFLNQYAQSTLENDFNSFAKNIFKGQTEFWQAVEKYDGLWGKFQLIVYFYQALDPTFDAEFFKEVSKY